MKTFISLLTIVLFSSINSFAETTDSVGYEADVETAETAAACAMRTKPGYNIRTRPKPLRRKARRDVCASTRNISSAQPIGIQGNWIKIIHPKCPNQQAYVHSKAFEPSDLAAYRSGQCRMSSTYGYRNPPNAPHIDLTNPTIRPYVNSKGNGKHQFPMSTCRGIRGDKYGSGLYGARRGGGKRTHAGCDYRAPRGTRLKSPCVGRITTAGYAGAAGNLLTIRCDNGDKFRMMHLQNGSMIKNGSRVGQGSYVGKVGKTGNANNSRMQDHLHIEAYVGGPRYSGVRRVNPMSLWNCK